MYFAIHKTEMLQAATNRAIVIKNIFTVRLDLFFLINPIPHSPYCINVTAAQFLS